MIAVIADDFTGAAEMGGIGLRYGLQVEINTTVNTRSDADLLIVAADTRSMDPEGAAGEMERLTAALLPLDPVLLYKKVDSVLRGHVAAEMRAQMRMMGLDKALLIPANPRLDRTIRDGHYYLQGRPVHLSSFSIDPEFAITSSDIQDMLRTREAPVSIRKATEALPAEGIVVGEVSTTGDLAAWAERIEGQIFAAGAAGFFAAILDKIYATGLASNEQGMIRSALTSGHPGLIVCGSTFRQSRETIQKIRAKGGPVSYMPAHLASLQPDSEADYDRWGDEVVSLIRSTGRAIIAVAPEDSVDGPGAARLLRERTARFVQKVFDRIDIRELFIEGGSTAYAILGQTGLHTFFPLEEIATGVIRMRVGEKPSLSVTVKPGSYTWPASTGI
jgi:uncharacterized protein YgbK (DUF1537 family)